MNDRPPRIVSTMLDVLMTEISDPNRLRRGKAYARQGAVTELRVEPGVVTARVQGSRPQSYAVTVRVRPMTDNPARPTAVVPSRRDISFACSCPDADSPCKHAVAVVLELSERSLSDASLLLRWRTAPSGDGSDAAGGRAPDEAGDAAHAGDRIGSAERRRIVAAHLGLDRHVELPAVPPLPRVAGPVVHWDEPWSTMLADALETIGRPGGRPG